jgi:hypothetical protein
MRRWPVALVVLVTIGLAPTLPAHAATTNGVATFIYDAAPVSHVNEL